THSFDPDRPGLAPYLWTNPGSTPTPVPPGAPTMSPPFPNTAGTYPYVSYPTSGVASFPPFTTNTAPGREFALHWTSLAAALERLDLNRPLPDYPPLSPNTGRFNDTPTWDGYQAATLARQMFANDIFLRLKMAVTGTYANNPDLNLMR